MDLVHCAISIDAARAMAHEQIELDDLASVSALQWDFSFPSTELFVKRSEAVLVMQLHHTSFDSAEDVD
jgi:hypothetical protein